MKPDSNVHNSSSQIKSGHPLFLTVVKYCMLSILLASAYTTSAQTIWIGTESSEWSSPTNWSNGLPNGNNNAIIPTEPTGDFLPSITQDITISFSIFNANILTIFGDVSNQDSIINFEDGSILNYGLLTNMQVLDNDGELFSAGDIINQGVFDNSGSLQFDFGDQFINEVDGSFFNYGPISLVDTYFENRGYLQLNGSTLESNGQIENLGAIENNGAIINLDCGIIRNMGSINNSFLIQNDNLFYNKGDFTGNSIVERLSVERLPDTSITANFECTDSEGWTHYSEAVNSKILLSIFTNGEDIGSVFDQSLVIRMHNDAMLGTGSVYNLDNTTYSDADDWYVINRSWSIESSFQDQIPFKVRLYFSPEDYEDIRADFPVTQTIGELLFFQLNEKTDAYDPNVPIGDIRYFERGTTGISSTWQQQETSNATFAEIEINGLNNAYSAGVKSWLGGTIPYHQSFTAISDNERQQVDLTWSTASESGSVAYTLERSNNGIDFTDLITIAAQGNTTTLSTYSAIDEMPSEQTPNFYRLRLLRTDGSIRYSDIREVQLLSGTVDVYPNPSTSELYVRFPDIETGSTRISIYDINGKLRYSDSFDIENNVITQNIYERFDLSSGIYSLKVDGIGPTQAYRFIKVAQ